MYFIMLWHLGTLLAGERLSLPGLPNSKRENDSPVSTAFKCKPTDPKPMQPYHLLYLTLMYQVNISPPLNHPRIEYQITRDHPCSPEPAEIKLFNPKPAHICLPRPFLPKETTVRLWPHFVLHSFCLLTSLGASPCRPAWCGMPLFLGNCE